MMEPAETWEGYPGWVETLVRAKLEPCEDSLGLVRAGPHATAALRRRRGGFNQPPRARF